MLMQELSKSTKIGSAENQYGTGSAKNTSTFLFLCFFLFSHANRWFPSLPSPCSTIFGIYLTLEITTYFVSYGGMVFDIIVGPLLLFKKTFWLGIFSSLVFHISNKFIFNIGIFPYLMIASTSLFFSPSWPRKFFSFFKRSAESPASLRCSPAPLFLRKSQYFWTLVIFLFLVFWITFPLRNYAMPGDGVVWTENGHMVGAPSLSPLFLFPLLQDYSYLPFLFLVFLENEVARPGLLHGCFCV